MILNDLYHKDKTQKRQKSQSVHYLIDKVPNRSLSIARDNVEVISKMMSVMTTISKKIDLNVTFLIDNIII